jgi:hypothetical protein
MPLGAVACFDFDKALMTPGGIVTTTATLTAGAGGNPVTVGSVGNGIYVGAFVTASGTGTLPAGVIKVSAISRTSVTVTSNPSGSGAATLTFINPNSGCDPDFVAAPATNPHPTAGGYQKMGNTVRYKRGI